MKVTDKYPFVKSVCQGSYANLLWEKNKAIVVYLSYNHIHIRGLNVAEKPTHMYAGFLGINK
mgnify:CR=1 FL=1